jgi:exosome complex component RRP42
MSPYTNIPLSPAELSYLQTSLSATPPIRPDGRSPTQFRPLVAEADILPSANGSARVCFSDGTEAIVGVKAEVEKSRAARQTEGEGKGEDVEMGEDINATGEGKGRNEWLDVAIDVPGLRDDDALPIFLGAMLSEALCADGGLRDRLWINSRFHWRLYVDVSCRNSTFLGVQEGYDANETTIDFAPVASSFLPSSSVELDNTPGSAQYPPTSSALARRRRPAFQ